MTLRQIVQSHTKGIEYGQTISKHDNWPLLIDKNDRILSLPPIINSTDLGKITTETKNILIEVTGTSLETVQDTLKIVVTTLSERGGKIYSCTQKYPYAPMKTTTPDLKEQPFQVSLDHTNKLLGTSLAPKQAIDLLNPSMTTYPILRSCLLPSLMEFLSNNPHVEYPQRIFEVGRCFTRDPSTPTRVKDIPKLSAVTVHATAGFTEIRQSLDSLLRSLGIEYSIKPTTHPSFLEGRTGQIVSTNKNIGTIGELNPHVIKAWGLSLPIGAFELDLSLLFNLN